MTPLDKTSPKIFGVQIKTGYAIKSSPTVYAPLSFDFESAKKTHIFPAQSGLAVLTVDIRHSVQACQQNSLLCRATPNVHPKGAEADEGERFQYVPPTKLF